MSYIKQQLATSQRLHINFNKDTASDVTLDGEEVNMDNINELCDLELAYVF